MEDVYGNNCDVLYLSGPVVDKENDNPILELVPQENLLYLTSIFTTELTEDNRVVIKMATQMKAEYTGLHRFEFKLTDDGDGDVYGTPNIYKVVIVIGLYPAKPIRPMIIRDTGPDEEPLDYRLEKNVVPEAPEINSLSDWFERRSYSDRKA